MPHCIDQEWCAADWTVPGVTAFTTTRLGGISESPWDSLNLGDHVGDDASAVAANRTILQSGLPAGTRLQWLEQVHGIDVVEATASGCPQADACWTATPGIACVVMTADCLPVLFASADGQCVGAAHAGWRGLLDGVLEETMAAMAIAPRHLQAWLGPAIGRAAFEVGPEVREAFLASGADKAAFTGSRRPGHSMADLYGLARQRLALSGLTAVSGGDYCTHHDATRFFSYRRDGQTGRMATLILINPL